MPEETPAPPKKGDVYFLFDVVRTGPTKPGEIEMVRVRSRSEEGARSQAVKVAGLEGPGAWQDLGQSVCRVYGRAVCQWAGLVGVQGFGFLGENQLAKIKIGHDVRSDEGRDILYILEG